MKKIIIVCQSLSGGGTEVALTELINHLDSRTYDVTLLLLDKDMDFFNRIKRNININIIKFDNQIWHNLVSMKALNGKIIKKTAFNNKFKIYDIALNHVHSSALKTKYDLAIDFYGYGSFTTTVVAKKITATKKATWIHDAQMPWIKNIDDCLTYFDRIFCVSKTIKSVFDHKYPKYSAQSEVLYNFIDKDMIIKKAMDFVPAEFKNDYFNIVSVGRLTEQKGFDIALNAAKLLKRQDIKFHWYIIGDGKDKKKLERQLRKLKLNDCFFFLGKKANPYPYIKNSDLFVLPSRHEGYSIAILEARVLKVPIVVSSIPVNKEQITNKKNGLISELTPTDLSSCILRMCQDRKLRDDIDAYLQNEDINFDGEIDKIKQLV